jgi:hypothetical protein
MAFDSSVKFNAGAPIDINKLNKLQDNITSVYQQNASAITQNNTIVGGIQKSSSGIPSNR